MKRSLYLLSSTAGKTFVRENLVTVLTSVLRVAVAGFFNREGVGLGQYEALGDSSVCWVTYVVICIMKLLFS